MSCSNCNDPTAMLYRNGDFAICERCTREAAREFKIVAPSPSTPRTEGQAYVTTVEQLQARVRELDDSLTAACAERDALKEKCANASQIARAANRQATAHCDRAERNYEERERVDKELRAARAEAERLRAEVKMLRGELFIPEPMALDAPCYRCNSTPLHAEGCICKGAVNDGGDHEAK